MKQVINERVTGKYRYWTEIAEGTETYYQIHYKSSVDCAVYSSLEEATANIRSTAALWRWDEACTYVQEKTRQVIVVKNHRSKVKG